MATTTKRRKRKLPRHWLKAVRRARHRLKARRGGKSRKRRRRPRFHSVTSAYRSWIAYIDDPFEDLAPVTRLVPDCECPVCIDWEWHLNSDSRKARQRNIVRCESCHVRLTENRMVRHKSTLQCQISTVEREMHLQGLGRVSTGDTTTPFLKKLNIPIVYRASGRSGGRGLYEQPWAPLWVLRACKLAHMLHPTLDYKRIVTDVRDLPDADRLPRLEALQQILRSRDHLDFTDAQARLDGRHSPELRTEIRLLYQLAQTDRDRFAQRTRDLEALALLAGYNPS